jgi:hypothetical protein
MESQAIRMRNLINYGKAEGRYGNSQLCPFWLEGSTLYSTGSQEIGTTQAGVPSPNLSFQLHGVKPANFSDLYLQGAKQLLG